MRRVCTIIARNYWAHARVLARSLRVHHPDVKLEVLVVDGDEDSIARASHESFEVLAPGDIGVDRDELHRMAAIYDLLELATALKPWLLLHLVERDETSVVYLDPDIEVFASLDDAWHLADSHGIVVTPHITEPVPGGTGAPTELAILGSGAYNLGFLGVGRDSRTFLRWWRDRLRRDALIAKEDGMFVDQRWVDLAPSYFNVHILRDPGWNVAYWNLPTRRLTRNGTVYEVDGEPLRFFHYSGFGPDSPHVLSIYEHDPRTRVDKHPALAELCRRYAQAVIAAGHRTYARVPYGFAHTADGLPLDRYARRLYRRELLAAERTGEPPPPDPFDPRSARAFTDWLCDAAGAHPVTRYMRGVYDERGDIQALFPDLRGRDARHFMHWARKYARFESNVEPELVHLATHRRRARPPGVNVAGYFSAESGVGEVARLMLKTLDAAGTETSIVPFRSTASRQEHTDLDAHFGRAEHFINLVCVNADELPAFLAEAGDDFIRNRRNIAVWQWEVEQFPEWMARSDERVDEIWVASEHAATAVRRQTTKPVFVVPPPVVRPAVGSVSLGDLGLDDGFLFLFCFDFDSVFERKNPLSLIDAFSRAFAPGSGPQLLIKAVRGEAHADRLDVLQAAASERPDIHIHDGYLDARTHAALVASCGAYVSLHRAEGFGLTMAEAMALGKPVVATGYSGNVEFMDDTNSWLVPYELVEIPQGCAPYPAGARWAEPDLDAAAHALRQIVDDPSTAHARASRAAEDIARLHNPEVRARLVVRRLMDGLYFSDQTAHRQAARPWTAVEAAAEVIGTGPDIGSPTSYGAFSRLVRRLVLRVGRHYVEHEQRVQASLLESVRRLEDRLQSESDASRLLAESVISLSDRLDNQEAKRREREEWWRTREVAEVPPPLSPREQRMRSYAGLFGTQAPVVAVGVAASDVTSLLSAHGVRVFTLDSAQTRAGPRVDAILEGLRGLGDHSLGGILTLHVLEHLSGTDLQHFLEVSRRKLAAGGVLVAETGECRGLTHDLPGSRAAMAPQALLELCRSTGFEQAYVLFPTGASSGTEADAGNGDFAIVAAVLLPTPS